MRYSHSDDPRSHCPWRSVPRDGHILRQFHRTSSRSSKHATEPDRNSTWPLLESSIWPPSCRPDTPSPRFGGPQAPTKDISPPRPSQRVPDRHVVLVHRQFPGACRQRRHPGRVSGPSCVVGKHVFNNADRIPEFPDAPTGLFTVCSGRQDGGQIDDPKLNFGRAES